MFSDAPAAQTLGGCGWSRIHPVDRTKKVPFPDIDAVVAEDRIGRRQVKIDVRDRDLQQVIVAADNLAFPSDLAVGGAIVLRRAGALREGDGFADTGTQLVDGLFDICVPWRCLS